VLAQLFSRAFFARQDTKTPMRFGLITVVVNIVLGVALFRLIGVAGIAAATATAWWVNVILMAAALARRGDYRPGPKAVSRLLRILAASVALGHASLGPVHGKELAIALTCLLAGGLYPVLLFASGGLTLTEAKAALRRRKGALVEPPAPLA
jgi:putative peptidoglycan lipid II flippase